MATRVSLTERSPGHGTVAVSVDLDRAALAAVGGLSALRSELAAQDLLAAGWSVTGPAGSPGGGATVAVQHGFESDAEAGRLMSDVAGAKVFGVRLTSHRTFWRTSYRLTGKVDLTCGVDCFGDAGLRTATGSTVGVDPGALSAGAGQQPSSVLRFSVEARLPDGVRSADGTVRPDRSVVWTPQLGQVVSLSATSSGLNTGAVAVVAAGGVALLVAVAGLAVWLVWGRRRRRRPVVVIAPPGQGEAVTPPS